MSAEPDQFPMKRSSRPAALAEAPAAIVIRPTATVAARRRNRPLRPTEAALAAGRYSDFFIFLSEGSVAFLIKRDRIAQVCRRASHPILEFARVFSPNSRDVTVLIVRLEGFVKAGLAFDAMHAILRSQ